MPLMTNIFPQSEVRVVYWVGFGEEFGDAMTHKLLDTETKKIIYRSAAKAQKSSTPSNRLASHGWEGFSSTGSSEDQSTPGSPVGPSEVSSSRPEPLQSSSLLEMMMIHLGPSHCLHLPPKTSLGGHSIYLLKKMGRDKEPR